MKTHNLIACAALVTAGILSAHAQETNVLKLYTALEVEFPTETGKLYSLQGSSDLTSWSDVGWPIFGHGRTVDKIFSTKTISNMGSRGASPWRARTPPHGSIPQQHE